MNLEFQPNLKSTPSRQRLGNAGQVVARRRPCGAYPSCGCDACDEDPVDIVSELRRDIDDLVAGRVTEEWDGERLHFASTHAQGLQSSGWTLVERSRRAAYGEPRRYAWAPWQRSI